MLGAHRQVSGREVGILLSRILTSAVGNESKIRLHLYFCVAIKF